jgi:hypothetical protein
MLAEILAMVRTSGTSEPVSDTIDNLPPGQWDNLVSEFAEAAHEQTHAFRGAAWGSRSTVRVPTFSNLCGWLSGLGSRWYELGGGAGGPGMRQFKRGLVGKVGVIAQLPGEFGLCRDPISGAVELAIDGARGLKSMLKRARQPVLLSGGETKPSIRSSRHLATATERKAVNGRLSSYSEL